MFNINATYISIHFEGKINYQIPTIKHLEYMYVYLQKYYYPIYLDTKNGSKCLVLLLINIIFKYISLFKNKPLLDRISASQQMSSNKYTKFDLQYKAS